MPRMWDMHISSMSSTVGLSLGMLMRNPNCLYMESLKCLLVLLKNMDCLYCVEVDLEIAVVDELAVGEGLKKLDKKSKDSMTIKF